MWGLGRWLEVWRAPPRLWRAVRSEHAPGSVFHTRDESEKKNIVIFWDPFGAI